MCCKEFGKVSKSNRDQIYELLAWPSTAAFQNTVLFAYKSRAVLALALPAGTLQPQESHGVKEEGSL